MEQYLDNKSVIVCDICGEYLNEDGSCDTCDAEEVQKPGYLNLCNDSWLTY